MSNPVTKERKMTPKQEAARRRAQKRQRTQLLVTAGIVAVIAAALIVIGLSLAQPTNFVVNSAAAATPDERPFELGAADAKIVVEEYGDYQCPACKAWHDDNQNKFINDFITPKKGVKFVFKPFPFLDSGSAAHESHTTAEGAYCASDQKRFWDYHNALYDNQPKGENTGFWSSSRLKQLAESLKLDTDAFNKCIDSNKYRTQVNDAATAAIAKDVRATPSFFINGKAFTGNNYDDLKKAVDAALVSPQQ